MDIAAKKDQINPAHYKSHPSGVECIEIIYPYRFDEAAAIKYLWRLGQKDKDVQELEKAAWYLKHAISTGILTTRDMITLDSTYAFMDWSLMEPNGFRRDAIICIICGDLRAALEVIYEWIAAIKGIDVEDVTTPNPIIGKNRG